MDKKIQMTQEIKFNKNIVEIIQQQVNTYYYKNWVTDCCKPNFTVSILHRQKDKQEIILTVEHCGRTRSRVIFPRDDSFYGYESLEEMMICFEEVRFAGRKMTREPAEMVLFLAYCNVMAFS